MKRHYIDDLSSWYQQSNRKPLVIRGARQVGKTWLVREFARQEGCELIEVNFERSPEYVSLFKSTSPDTILSNLEKLMGRRIERQKTLLFLDEIQKAPEAFANLRWFHEEKSDIAVIATGSLLDFTLQDHEFSMPVGRISYLFMEPMNFKEFLHAQNESLLADHIGSFQPGSELPDALHRKLGGLFKDYIVIGGMPAATQSWSDHRSVIEVNKIHRDLINTYVDDFNKYAGRMPIIRLQKVFNAVPRFLGKKFKYTSVDREERAKPLGQALGMLCKARLCHKVICSHGHGLPLAAEEDEKLFKVILLDTGLASAMLGLQLKTDDEIGEFVRVNEGGIAEQVVGQTLRTLVASYVNPELHYYVREKKGSEAEIDYLFPLGPTLFPVEVKAGTTGLLRSLHQFMAERKLGTAFRINTSPPTVTDINTTTATGKMAKYKLISLPFYMSGEISRLAEDKIRK